MDYKYLIHIIGLLLSAPKKAWQEITSQSFQSCLTLFVFPMIALAALASFLGCLLRVGISGAEQYQYAMRECCSLAVALFAGFFLSAYLTNTIGLRFMNQTDSPLRSQVLCGYGMVVVMLMYILTALFPDLGMLALLGSFYTVYVVWEGVPRLYPSLAEDNLRLRMTALVSALLLIVPYVIERVFNQLSMALG